MSFGAGANDVYLIKIGSEVGIKEKGSSQKVFFVVQSLQNPFKDRTMIKCGLPKSSNVRIVIYNLLGQEVRTLVNGKRNAGIHEMVWHGRDNIGRELASGVYFCNIQVHEGLEDHTVLETGSYAETRKMILLR